MTNQATQPAAQIHFARESTSSRDLLRRLRRKRTIGAKQIERAVGASDSCANPNRAADEHEKVILRAAFVRHHELIVQPHLAQPVAVVGFRRQQVLHADQPDVRLAAGARFHRNASASPDRTCRS